MLGWWTQLDLDQELEGFFEFLVTSAALCMHACMVTIFFCCFAVSAHTIRDGGASNNT